MPESFGDRLKKYRESKKWSQEQLAEILDTSKQVISRYETNQRTPKISVAQEYAEKLGLPLTYLVSGDEENLNAEPYYLDPEVAAMAEELKNNPQYRVLFDASRKVSKKDMEMIIDLVKRMAKEDDTHHSE